MGLGFGGKAIINACIGKVSKAREACAELGQSILPAQQTISEKWKGEAGTAMLSALNEVWAEVNEAHQLLLSAESVVQAQGNYIINNWVDDEEGG